MSGTELAGVATDLHAHRAVRESIPAAVEQSDDSEVGEGSAGRHASARCRAEAGLPSSAIHELRTPLTSIHGYAQVLQRNLGDNPKATRALNVVVRESTRLSAMLGLLSELAELESGDVPANPTRLDVAKIVEGAVDEVTRCATDQHQIGIEGDAEACCNPALLSQALMHVLTNAMRFSAEGEPIAVSIAQTDRQVEIVVRSRGSRIEANEGDCIYEPFARGCHARPDGVRGLGLGLYLARLGLEHTGGQIDHRSLPDGSTAFRLQVPRA